MLAVVVSYGRKALRILALPLTTSRAASQAQVELLEDLEKLTETRGPRAATEPKSPVYGGVGHVLSAMPEGPAASQAGPAVSVRRESTSSLRALAKWLQTPMGNRPGPAWRRVSRQVPAEPEATAYGGVGRMLSPMPEAPAASHAEPVVMARSEAISPWRGLVKWLRTPMGNRPGPAWRRVSRQVS